MKPEAVMDVEPPAPKTSALELLKQAHEAGKRRIDELVEMRARWEADHQKRMAEALDELKQLGWRKKRKSPVRKNGAEKAVAK